MVESSQADGESNQACAGALTLMIASGAGGGALESRMPARAFSAVEDARSPAERADPTAEAGASGARAERWELSTAGRAVTTYRRDDDDMAVQAEYTGPKPATKAPFQTSPKSRRQDDPPCRIVTGHLEESEPTLPVGSDETTTVAYAEKMAAAIRGIAEYVEFQAPTDTDIEWVPRRPTPSVVIAPVTDETKRA